LLSRGRWPLAENDAEARHARLPAPSMFAPGMPRTTPGLFDCDQATPAI